MTSPTSIDKNLSISAGYSSPSGNAATPAKPRDSDAGGDRDQTIQPAVLSDRHIDVGRATQFLDLATAPSRQQTDGGVQSQEQAQALVHRIKALVNDDPGAFLQAQTSALNMPADMLLEVPPT